MEVVNFEGSEPLPPDLIWTRFWPEALKGDILNGGHLKMGFRTDIRTWHVDFALRFALETSILTALSMAIPQGMRRLDRESAVQTGKAPSRRHRALKNAILRCPGLRCRGLGLSQSWPDWTWNAPLLRSKSGQNWVKSRCVGGVRRGSGKEG